MKGMGFSDDTFFFFLVAERLDGFGSASRVRVMVREAF